MNLKQRVVRKRTLNDLSKSSFVEDFYRPAKNVRDKRFGQISIWAKTSGDDLLMLKVARSGDPPACRAQADQAKQRLAMNHNYLLHMLDFAVKRPAPGQFEVWSFYRAPLQDLKKEQRRRRALGR